MLLETVPNISEGRDGAIVDAIAQAALQGHAGLPGQVRLLHLDRGPSAHRSVLTFAGEPALVVDSLFAFIAAAVRHIDLRMHRGPHPRIGAADVVPLVPLQGMRLADADRLAVQLARRVADELALPVYLYAASAQQPSRALLANIRRGGFERLARKMTRPEWQPDFGPPQPHPSAGACVIGARPIMIAYNVNLTGPQALKVAQVLAKSIRENPQAADQSDRFRGLRAIAWYMPQFDRVQVSMNITDPLAAPLHAVYGCLKRLASRQGVAVDGSELVGLIPQAALEAAGRGFVPGADSAQAITAAVEGLGLDRVKTFDPAQHILERALGIDPIAL